MRHPKCALEVIFCCMEKCPEKKMKVLLQRTFSWLFGSLVPNISWVTEIETSKHAEYDFLVHYGIS